MAPNSYRASPAVWDHTAA